MPQTAHRPTMFPAGSRQVAERHQGAMDRLLTAARDLEALIADAHDAEQREFWHENHDPHVDSLAHHRDRIACLIAARMDLERIVDLVTRGLAA
jgi:hypothetical protein